MPLNCLFVVEKLSQGGQWVNIIIICFSKLPLCSIGSAGSFSGWFVTVVFFFPQKFSRLMAVCTLSRGRVFSSFGTRHIWSMASRFCLTPFFCFLGIRFFFLPCGSGQDNSEKGYNILIFLQGVFCLQSPLDRSRATYFLLPCSSLSSEKGWKRSQLCCIEKGLFILVQLIRRGHLGTQITSAFSWQMCSIVMASLALSKWSTELCCRAMHQCSAFWFCIGLRGCPNSLCTHWAASISHPEKGLGISLL